MVYRPALFANTDAWFTFRTVIFPVAGLGLMVHRPKGNKRYPLFEEICGMHTGRS
jgi:hypothetical protein